MYSERLRVLVWEAPLSLSCENSTLSYNSSRSGMSMIWSEAQRLSEESSSPEYSLKTVGMSMYCGIETDVTWESWGEHTCQKKIHEPN